jgi:hypothetical protein
MRAARMASTEINAANRVEAATAAHRLDTARLP